MFRKFEIAILFDAVDEIGPTYKSKVINMIKALTGSGSKTLIITNRALVKQDLETELEYEMILKLIDELRDSQCNQVLLKIKNLY